MFIKKEKLMKPMLFKQAFLTAALLLAGTAQAANEAPKTYPEGELGRMVKLGEAIANETDTHPLTKDYVNNKLQCKSCHLKGSDGKPGTWPGLATWIGTATVFPAYSGREKTIQSLQDRSNNCFMRSMNGIRLPDGSEASLALAAYITWLSTGMPIQMSAKRPVTPLMSEQYAAGQKKFAALQKKATHANYENGKQLFDTKCAMCHGRSGAGMGAFPPLWGKDAKGKWLSYNTGAGMSKLNKAPIWIQMNMPLGQGGTLSDREAADIALYIDAQPRASFDLQKRLPPKAEMGIYNSNVMQEHHNVRSNFKAFGLDVDAIRGDHVIK
jgi:thiosulfate dehydrogenase